MEEPAKGEVRYRVWRYEIVSLEEIPLGKKTYCLVYVDLCEGKLPAWP